MVRAKKLVAGSLIAAAMMMSLPGHAKHPPLVVATIAAWAPAVFTVAPGETVQFSSSDTPRSFVTDDAICAGSLGELITCDAFIAGGPLTSRTLVRVHPSAPKGSHMFRCGIHPAWMRGVVVVD